MLTVYISRFGSDEIEVEVVEGTTVAQVIRSAGLELSGREQVFVSGVQATMQSIVEEGDILNIVTPKQAGADTYTVTRTIVSVHTIEAESAEGAIEAATDKGVWGDVGEPTYTAEVTS